MRWRFSLVAGVLFLLPVCSAGVQDVGPERVHLELRVIDEQGDPVSWATVRVRGSSSEQTVEADRKGRRGLDLSPGIYTLGFSRAGFHELDLHGVEIRIPKEPERRKTKLFPVRVMMQRRPPAATSEVETEEPPHPRVPVEPPSLRVKFEPEGLRKGLQARGVLTLTNIGEEPIRLPLEVDSLNASWTPHTLLLAVRISMDESEVGFNEAFACEPEAGTCRELAPGESAQVSLGLRDLPSHRAGLDVQARWDRSGAVTGEVSAYLVYPQASGEEPEIRTRPVKKRFRVMIKEPR